MAGNEIGTPVELYVYDISRGMASVMAPMFISREVEGIWHTAIVAYGMEYFYGAGGIQMCTPESTVLGEPLRKEKLGDTFVPYTVYRDFIQALGESSFAGSSYSLVRHNCNHFSEEVAQFLCGVSIPKYILDLPEVFLSTPLGQTLRPLIEQLENSAQNLPINQPIPGRREESPDFVQLNSEIEKIRYNNQKLEERRNSINEKILRKERKKEKKRRKLLKAGIAIPPELQVPIAPLTPPTPPVMADMETVNGGESQQIAAEPIIDIEEEERREEEERKKNREPPIVYKGAIDVKAEFEALSNSLTDKLTPEDHQSLTELRQYMLEDEGSWALGDGFLNFLGRLLHDKGLCPETRVRTLNVLAEAALKDDVILLLHQDRREHVIMNYAFDIDRWTCDEQKSLALFIANMFENLSSSEWLLYISEWAYCNQQTSNIRVTTKVAVHCLLSDDAVLQDRGAAIVHNMACKEVFDDVAVELTMALLQYFNSKPNEEQLYRCFKALARFTQISSQEVPQLIQMIGPNPNEFKGTSERVDELITQINKKLR